MMKSTLSFILSLLVKIVIFVLAVYLVMSVLGIKLDDIKKLLPQNTTSGISRVYAEESEEALSETVCVFYDGDRLSEVKAVPRGMAFASPALSKPGYTFLGWKSGDELYTSEIIPRGSVMFLYSVYTPINYTVSYYDLDGSLIGTYTVTVESDLSSILPAALDDKEFVCWYNAFDSSEEITSDYSVTKDLILLPKYAEATQPFFLAVFFDWLWFADIPVILKVLLLVALVLVLRFLFKLSVKGLDKLFQTLYRLYYKFCYNRYNSLTAQGKPVSDKLLTNAAYYVARYTEDSDADDNCN